MAAANAKYVKGMVPDLILLEEITENAIVDTLKNRLQKDMIYTYIGNVVLSMNPFREIPGIYGPDKVHEYEKRYYQENEPHLFALAEAAYRTLQKEKSNQCVIISGESGAGKTEASKKIMYYISKTSGSSEDISVVKERLLRSNPVLESFGNAKTLRNNNSSRFGKYLEIVFDVTGDPIGGRTRTFLLEKSRVVAATKGERSFHIFYQITAGLFNDKSYAEYHIREPSFFRFLSQTEMYMLGDSDGESEEESSLKETLESLAYVGVEVDRINEIISIISAILWMGQIDFESTSGADASKVSNDEPVEVAAKLLKVDREQLENCFLKRNTKTGKEIVRRNHTKAEASDTRDALCKTIYFRLFNWIVEKINSGIDPSLMNVYRRATTHEIGILDIYGFEVFQDNSFEQFCINYVNEKLQQYFIECTLKAEQEEYEKEGIAWTEIEYFNNQIVCDLIEKPKNGIIDYLNETCVFPKGDDNLFLEKINKTFAAHPHFLEASVKQKVESFTIRHYAGDVIYKVNGFVEKNRDLVWNDLLLIGENSQLDLIQKMFPKGEAEEQATKRPPSAGTQFRDQVSDLITALNRCTPHYVRCIKPNDTKSSTSFDYERVKHQVRYLGLVENVKVRRAGFAFRMDCDEFIRRYKMISGRTWPNWSGPKQEGVVCILQKIRVEGGDKFQLGKTKVFVKEPQTIMDLEAYREIRVVNLVSVIKSVLKMKNMVEVYSEYTSSRYIQIMWKGYTARRMALEVRSGLILQRVWKGFMARKTMQEEKSARVIQTNWRTYSLKKLFTQISSAIVLQSKWKMSVQRHVIVSGSAAATIQECWRSAVMRGVVREAYAASKIQAVMRTYPLARWIKHNQAAIRIQAAVRPKSHRVWLRQTYAARTIQSVCRMVPHTTYVSKYYAASRVQAVCKGFVVRKWVRQYRAASKIQARARIILAKKWEFNTKAIYIVQGNWKRFLWNQWYKQYCASRAIERFARTVLAKRTGQMIKGSVVLRDTFKVFRIIRPYICERNSVLSFYSYEKDRRRGSAAIFYTTLFLPNALNDQILLKELRASGDKSITFIDECVKVNRNLQLDPRILVLSENMLFMFESKKGMFKLHCKFKLLDITKLGTSKLDDNFLVLFNTVEYDLLIELKTKSAFIFSLLKARKILGKEPVKSVISNKIEVSTKKGSRVISFVYASLTDKEYLVSKDPGNKKSGIMIEVKKSDVYPKDKIDILKDIEQRLKYE